MRVVVAGAGLAGLFAARTLADLGADVTVVAEGPGAFGAGAGIASAQFRDPFLAPYARRSLALLAARAPVRRPGMAQIALTERSALRLEGVPGTRKGLPRALRSVLSPGFRRGIVAAVFSREDVFVDLPLLRRSLARGLRTVRARVRDVASGEVRTSAGRFAADRVVVALGAGAGPFVPPGLLSVRLARTASAALRLPAMFHVTDGGLYGRPDGRRALVGDGDEPWTGPGGPPPRAGAGFARFVEERLREMFRRPGRVAPARQGLVAMTRTRRPYVRVSGGVAVLAGFGGDGLSLAPAFAEEAAIRLLSGDQSSVVKTSRS